jgi:hypothetical protein
MKLIRGLNPIPSIFPVRRVETESLGISWVYLACFPFVERGYRPRACLPAAGGGPFLPSVSAIPVKP